MSHDIDKTPLGMHAIANSESGLYVLQFNDGVVNVGEKTVVSTKEPVTVKS